MTKRYVVQECNFTNRWAQRITGWEVFDRETGKRAKGTEPHEIQRTAWEEKDKLNRKDELAKKKAAAKDDKKKKK